MREHDPDSLNQVPEDIHDVCRLMFGTGLFVSIASTLRLSRKASSGNHRRGLSMQESINHDLFDSLPERGDVASPSSGTRGQAGGMGGDGSPSLPSNLVKETDGFLKIDGNNELEVTLKKCSCRCVWCPICWEYVYVPKLKAFLELMDYRRVRHITPTIARDQFNSIEEAYRLFNAGEFVHRLTRGLRKRDGIKWTGEYVYPPIQWHSWLWWVEFHQDGTAHFHLALEVDQYGQEGMVGGDRLRYYWPHGRINEAYFEDEVHWKFFLGYGIKKGYASKDDYQGRLPELLDQEGSKKIRRWGHSQKKDKTGEEAYVELMRYFIHKRFGQESPADKPGRERNKKRPYSVIISNCGIKSFMNLNTGDMRLKAVVDIPYREMKNIIKGEHVKGKGYVGHITHDELGPLMFQIEKVVSLKNLTRF